jgi:3-hydroxyacyl-CoA dehydrogenase/enoyl-CoA hydratase/3-hydroxybutyryl-CoA epimerase/enoyl-CoA isomerase
MDSIGMSRFNQMCEQYKDLGPLYHPTDGMRQMAEEGRSFFPAAA